MNGMHRIKCMLVNIKSMILVTMIICRDPKTMSNLTLFNFLSFFKNTLLGKQKFIFFELHNL